MLGCACDEESKSSSMAATFILGRRRLMTMPGQLDRGCDVGTRGASETREECTRHVEVEVLEISFPHMRRGEETSGGREKDLVDSLPCSKGPQLAPADHQLPRAYSLSRASPNHFGLGLLVPDELKLRMDDQRRLFSSARPRIHF